MLGVDDRIRPKGSLMDIQFKCVFLRKQFFPGYDVNKKDYLGKGKGGEDISSWGDKVTW